MVPKFSEIGRLLDRLFSFFSRRRSVVEEWTSDNGNEGDGGRPGGRDFRIFTKMESISDEKKCRFYH